MRGSMSNDLCNDNIIQNHYLFLHLYKFDESCSKTSKINLLSIRMLTDGATRKLARKEFMVKSQTTLGPSCFGLLR